MIKNYSDFIIFEEVSNLVVFFTTFFFRVNEDEEKTNLARR